MLNKVDGINKTKKDKLVHSREIVLESIEKEIKRKMLEDKKSQSLFKKVDGIFYRDKEKTPQNDKPITDEKPKALAVREEIKPLPIEKNTNSTPVKIIPETKKEEIKVDKNKQKIWLEEMGEEINETEKEIPTKKIKSFFFGKRDEKQEKQRQVDLKIQEKRDAEEKRRLEIQLQKEEEKRKIQENKELIKAEAESAKLDLKNQKEEARRKEELRLEKIRLEKENRERKIREAEQREEDKKKRQAEKIRLKLERQKQRAEQKIINRKNRKKKIKKLILDSKRLFASLKINLYYGFKKIILILLFLSFTTVFIYFCLVFLVTKLRLDNSFLRQASRILPVPALFTSNSLIEYYRYEDLKVAEFLGNNFSKTQIDKNLKLKFARELIIGELVNKYNIKEINEPARWLEITEKATYDKDINQVPINRITRIMGIIKKEGNFVEAAKFGDEQGIITVNDSAIKFYNFGEEIKNLKPKSTSEIITTPEGYYIFKSLSRNNYQHELSYVFVKANDLNSFIDKEISKFKIWSLVD